MKECGDDGCTIVQKHEKKLFDEEHGVFARLEKICACIKELKLKKVGWKSLVVCLAFIIGTFGYGWYRTTANAENIPEVKENQKQIVVKITTNEKDIAEIKKDVTYNTERIDKLITLAEDQQKIKEEDRKEQKKMFEEILKRLPK